MDNEDKKVYTLEDVAETLNLSKTTVSRAISGKGRVAKSTRELVQTFINTHDYRPSALARGLASKKTYNFALVLPDEYYRTEMLFFHDFLTNCAKVAAEHSYDVLMAVTGEDELQHIGRLIQDRKVDGVILTRATTDRGVQDFLRDKKVPYVVVGRPEDTSSSWVDFANRQATEELTEILLRNGIRKLALVGGDVNHRVSGDRERGYRDAFQKSGLTVEESLIYTGLDNEKAIQQAVEKIIAQKAQGILCMDEYQTYTVLSILRQKMIPVPEEMKLACCFDSTLNERSIPSITGIKFDTGALARTACEILFRKIGQEQDLVEVNSRYQIILRNSTQNR